MKSALTIAASDSSGGAGVSADLKAFSFAGVHGCSVITCVTAQSTQKVTKIHEVPIEVIEAQLDALLDDINILACKTGMLYSPKIVELVAKKSEAFDFPVVVDPVMKATVGENLYESGFIEALSSKLIPKAELVTPNIPEAEAITGQKIKDLEDMKEACRNIHALGCSHVLLTGGHLEEQKAMDVLFDGKDFRLYLSKVYPKDLHGTGCTFSALITALLAKGKKIEEAVSEAKIQISNIIGHGYSIGKGIGVAGLTSQPSFSPEELEVIEELQNTMYELQDIVPISFMPEVGINIGFALPGAQSLDEVCALEGRLIRVGERIGGVGGFKFGASKHIARIILTAMRFESDKRSAMNIRYNQDIIDICSSLDLSIGTFDRKEEPDVTTTMEWGTESAIKRLGKVPDIIYDEGGIGKEPMIRILGKNPSYVLEKLKLIIKKHDA
ncbi:MAG: bifunctional hydroxymethylpyrimidine kinase/phosphomethylpyrimidine kinase [Methanomassiliicoccales archaeon]|nr:MAG: bifunctional hydroxymethylpyrimidine kinase/phosphomethylpyrimidine kinase [Methanomassiliicoccales archaeon]